MNRKLHASKKNERHLTRHGIFDASHFLSIPSVPYRMTKKPEKLDLVPAMPTSRTRARSDWAVSRASLRIFLSWSWAETAAKNEVAREESLLPSSTSVWSSHCLSCKSWFVNLLIESAPGPDKLKLYWDIKASYENINSRLYFIQIYIVFVKKTTA